MKVIVTGTTGFKGAWLAYWLHSIGAKVTGISLKPESNSILFKSLNINKKIYKSKFSSKINKKSYSNYKYSFLTSKSIKKINNSEILEKIITQ